MNPSITVKVDKSKSVVVTDTQFPDTCETFQWDGTTLSGEDETCQFVGQKNDEESSSAAEQWCVGVLGDDNVLTVHPAQCITLRQKVTGYQEHFPTLKGAAVQYKALFEDFGSAKKRKVLKSREANRLGAGKIELPTGQSLGSEPTAIDQATDEWRKAFLPRWDASATQPREVYDATEIAGESAWNALVRIARDSLRSDKIQPSIAALLSKESLTENQKCSLILCHFFAELYMRFHSRSIPPIEYTRGSFYGQPFAVAERFLEKFSSRAKGVKHAMSKANQDSCLVHIFLLYMMGCHAQKMESNSIRSLASDLRIESATIVHLLRQAGVKVVVNKSKGTIVAKLTLPLKFPAMPRQMQR